MKISILFDRIRWEEKALYSAAKKMGISFNLVDAKKSCLNIVEESDLENFGDIALQRCISYFRGLYLTHILENQGIPVINSSKVSLTCGNKLLTTLALAKAKIPTPKTFVAFTPKSALKAINMLGYPAILKPIIGSWGRLIAPLKDTQSAKAILESREQMSNALQKIYYIQEMVTRPSRDIRTVVIDDQIIAAIYRYAPRGDWRTNIALGGSAAPCPITDELEEVVLRAAKIIGGGVLGIDAMESQEGIMIHEANSTVEFKGAASATGIDIAGKILEYAVRRLKK